MSESTRLAHALMTELGKKNSEHLLSPEEVDYIARKEGLCPDCLEEEDQCTCSQYNDANCPNCRQNWDDCDCDD